MVHMYYAGVNIHLAFVAWTAVRDFEVMRRVRLIPGGIA